MKYRAIKGMNDILPDEIGRWRQVEEAFRQTAHRYAYREVRTPVVESTSLFSRSIGEGTDIVDKEMYSFDHHRDHLTLRPEGTAGVVRAYVQHHVNQQEPVSRWFYFGAMFRGERPARGRYRQFHQLGCEVFGDLGPAVDAEMIDMIHSFFTALGIEQFEVVINSLGSAKTRERYRDKLVDYLTPLKNQLGEDSQRRLSVNPLRILDSKNPKDQELLVDAPKITELLDDNDRAHWESLLGYLRDLETPFRVDTSLVRGLDYYTRTLFEVRSNAGDVGAQNALGGGGRYDGLVAELGGAPTPAIGFALGVERILLAMKPEKRAPAGHCAVLPLGEKAASVGLVLARRMRAQGVEVDVDTRGGAGASLKSMLRRANARGARLCLVLGESELADRKVQVKDLVERTQQLMDYDAAVGRVVATVGRLSAKVGGSI